MFYRKINEDIQVSLSIPAYAKKMNELINKNRKYLKKWLPWLNDVKKVSDTERFINLQLQRLAKGEALHETIFYKGEMAGVLGYNQIDSINGIGYIGYWMGEKFNGKGIMTLAVTDLIEIGFTYFSIQKIDIRCAYDNKKSRAIPERIGFKNEGIIRNAQKVNSIFFNHVIYGLLKEEFRQKQISVRT